MGADRLSGNIENWHLILAAVTSAGDQPGDRRTAHGADGSSQVERLDKIDAAAHRYRLHDDLDRPAARYHAELRIDPAEANGSSVMRWRAEIDATGDDE